MNNEKPTTKREFEPSIETANNELERLDAEVADLKGKLAAAPTAPTAEPPKVTAAPVAPKAVVTPAKVDPFIVGDTTLGGLSRAIAARNAELEARK